MRALKPIFFKTAGKYLSRTALIENRASGQLCLPLSDQGKQLALGVDDDPCRDRR